MTSPLAPYAPALREFAAIPLGLVGVGLTLWGAFSLSTPLGWMIVGLLCIAAAAGLAFERR